MVEVIADLAGSGAMITQRPGQDLTPEMATPIVRVVGAPVQSGSSRAWLVLAEDATRLAVSHLQMAADQCSQSPKRPTCKRPFRHNLRPAAAKAARTGADQCPQSAAVRPVRNALPRRLPASHVARIEVSKVAAARSISYRRQGPPWRHCQVWPCRGSDEVRRETELPVALPHLQPAVASR